MAIHIWCPRPSDSAIKLRDVIRVQGIKCYKSSPNKSTKTQARFSSRVNVNDLVMGWGPGLQIGGNIVTLNGYIGELNKMEQLIQLAQDGIPCPEVFDAPAPDRLGRSFRHQCASDLIRGNGRDYYTQKLPFVRECRIHVFQGKAIQSGMKVPTSGAHEWIRSSSTGWKLDYKQAPRIKQDRRELAKRAVAALRLDFGAVDIGIVKNGTAAVIEVNTAPGLDITTAEVYARHIIRVYNERNT